MQLCLLSALASECDTRSRNTVPTPRWFGSGAQWAVLLLAACSPSAASTPDGQTPGPGPGPVAGGPEQVAHQVVTVVDDLDNPWAVAWLPDGDMLVTERPGRLRIVR
ncbi:MAG: PQQ-dependent sugar dehydrogenase, partial [Gammaproteobacteria bacterium]|nr:PQQ-dependent sugar dehydrogenase [Gammaproteobacteria bacterium]